MTTKTSDQHNKERRKLLTPLSAIGLVSVLPAQWIKPVVDNVILPAHAQTSTCTGNAQVGGPLNGNPHNANTCAEACEAEATALDAQFCAVTETTSASGEVSCLCDIEHP